MTQQSATTQKVKRIPIDLGGPTPICIEPHRRPYPTGEWVSAMIDSYLSRDDFDAQNVSISFVQGGMPNQELIDALSNRPFTLATRPDELSRKDAEWLVEQGCQGIELNVYTTQQFVLDRKDCLHRISLKRWSIFSREGSRSRYSSCAGSPTQTSKVDRCSRNDQCRLRRLAPVLVLSEVNWK